MDTFRVAVCQVEAHGIDEAELSLAGILSALDDAGRAGAQLVALPECSYPAYELGDSDPYGKPGVRPFEDVLELLRQRARTHGYWLAAGLAVPHPDGGVTNSGVVISPDGEIRGRYDKCFLWHFDKEWFQPGHEFPVFDTGFCRFGILICADGRQPEVARSLAVAGAEVILDLTAWVTSGPDLGALSTAQVEHLMPVRGFENGVWIAAADKWGTENGSIIYAGRSCIIDPCGSVVALAPSNESAVLDWEIAPMLTETVTRRPAFYKALARPTADLPITRLMTEPIVPSGANRRVAVANVGPYWEPSAVVAILRTQRRQATNLLVLSGMTGPEGWEVGLQELEVAARELDISVVVAVTTNGCQWEQSIALVTPQRTYEHKATHGRGIGFGETPAAVIETPAGRVGVLSGEEGLVPEVARCLALEGAEIIAWSGFKMSAFAHKVARTRAEENRVYVAAAWGLEGTVVAPGGNAIAVVPEGSGMLVGAQVNAALARWKDMAPGTNVILDRNPSAYTALTRI